MAISRALIEALMSGEVGTTGGDSMLSEYQKNPFYMQDKINKDSLSTALAKSLLNQNTLNLSGQFTDSGGGDAPLGLDPAVEAFLDAETQSEQGGRIQAEVPAFFSDALALGVVPAVFGLMGSTSTTSPGAIAAQANVFGRTPAFLQAMMPQSYVNAAGFMNQNDSIFNPMNPNGSVTMGPQQSAALAAQDMGLFDNAADRGAWYGGANAPEAPFTSPVDMTFSPTTPIGPLGGDSNSGAADTSGMSLGEMGGVY